MDEQAYQQTYAEMNQQKCWFEKALLSRQCDCSCSRRLFLAEREAVSCTHPQMRTACQVWLNQLKQYWLQQEEGQISHSVAMKLQVGGLQGLHRLLYPQQTIPAPIPDIAALIRKAPHPVPYAQLRPYIQAYEGRRSKRKKRIIN